MRRFIPRQLVVKIDIAMDVEPHAALDREFVAAHRPEGLHGFARGKAVDVDEGAPGTGEAGAEVGFGREGAGKEVHFGAEGREGLGARGGGVAGEDADGVGGGGGEEAADHGYALSAGAADDEDCFGHGGWFWGCC